MKHAALGMLLLALCACTAIEREAGYPGGNLGFAADRYAIFAQGQQQRVNRYVLSLALLSPLIAETASTATEAKVSAERINQMFGHIRLLKEAANTCSRTASPELSPLLPGCQTTYVPSDETGLSEVQTGFNFETQSHEVSRSLYAATKTALDNLNIRTRVSNLAGLSPTEIFRNLLRVRFLVPVAARYFATYRDVTLIFASSVISSCSESDQKNLCQTQTPNLASVLAGTPAPTSYADAPVIAAYAALLNRKKVSDADLATEARPIGDLYNAAEAYIDGGNPWRFDPFHAAALISHIDRACARLKALQETDQITKESASDCSSADPDGQARNLLVAFGVTPQPG